ncbi:MAG: type II toxin-antitoxin system VapC family toxin [Carbonactinosporaceae bacterium]
MIVYFDTSAFVPLLVTEPGSKACQRLWEEADDVVTSRLLYVEAAAALAQALRLGRLVASQHRFAIRVLDRLWTEIDVLDVGQHVVGRAAELAYRCALRSYDTVHCASAEHLDEGDLVVATGDRKLAAACQELGLAVADVCP